MIDTFMARKNTIQVIFEHFQGLYELQGNM